MVAYGGTTIDLIDVAARKKLRTLDISPNRRPHGIAWLDNDRLIATAEDSRSVAIVSRSGKVRSIPTDQDGTHMVVVSPDRVEHPVEGMAIGAYETLGVRARREIGVHYGDFVAMAHCSQDRERFWPEHRVDTLQHGASSRISCSCFKSSHNASGTRVR
ncbi:hypothetical protein RPR59_07965 [Stakelama saccharophila]|uniref:Uncharacterized protein n=1 Tax=Stakelama saccharophila TaxID=3075605 RepID=A0ABZ0B6A4_9SPHN|nr:hypothetical protein [Stakelama sp. W311]WNO52418.1 hypothetical protein RPR59_07965 [Stakelama sp. W311]